MSEFDSRDPAPSDLADMAGDLGCPRCHGLGYVQHRGEPYAADPCGCDEPDEDEDNPQ